MQRWKGTIDLIFDAVEATTNLVEHTHASVAKKAVRPFASVEPLATLVRAVQAAHDTTAAGAYMTIRAVTRSVKKLLDLGTEPFSEAYSMPSHAPLGLATPLRSDATSSLSWWIDHTESVVNGFCGDHLSRRQNGLDLGMSLRHQGHLLPLERVVLQRSFPEATGKLCVFVHGLKCTEWVWSNSAERFHGDPTVTYGSLLQSDLGFTPFYVRYNTGRRVPQNGRLLSTLLTQLVAAYPRKVEEIVLVGHSMGGLVVRSAAHYGQASGEPWVQRLRHVFSMGAPHLGAPLPKATHVLSDLLGAFDTAGTQVLAQVLNVRSAGMKDLRFGYTIDEEGENKDPDALLENHRQTVPLIDGVGYYALAATITRGPKHPIGQLLGDLLVRPPSAAGYTPAPRRESPLLSGYVFGGMHHFDLANHPDVYAFIRQCIEDGA